MVQKGMCEDDGPRCSIGCPCARLLRCGSRSRRTPRGVCSPGRGPRPATTAGRRPSMAGCPHTPRCTRRASAYAGFGAESRSGRRWSRPRPLKGSLLSLTLIRPRRDDRSVPAVASVRVRVASWWFAPPVARPGGCAPQPESASSYHGRPPAIHGRLSAHPPVHATGSDVRRLRCTHRAGALLSEPHAAVHSRSFAIDLDLRPDATTARSPPRTQGDVQSRPWMAGGRMWEQDAEISGWASPCGRGGLPGASLSSPRKGLRP